MHPMESLLSPIALYIINFSELNAAFLKPPFYDADYNE